MARPRTFDEADVVAAARDEFWSRGYGATSMDDLPTATSLGRGSLYGAFGAPAASVAAAARRGCLMARSAAELAGSDDEIARTVERTLAAWRRELVDCIKAAQREGSIDPNENPQALATLLLAFLRGMEALGKGGAKPAQIKAAADEVLSLISVG